MQAKIDSYVEQLKSVNVKLEELNSKHKALEEDKKAVDESNKKLKLQLQQMIEDLHKTSADVTEKTGAYEQLLKLSEEQ